MRMIRVNPELYVNFLGALLCLASTGAWLLVWLLWPKHAPLPFRP